MPMHQSCLRVLLTVSLIPAAALFAGCMQLDLTVEMHEKDGGATVTERIRVTRRVLDACPAQADRKKLLRHLGRAAALERMKKMGKDVSLQSHKQETLPDGGIESVAVYTIPDFNHLIIPNPFVSGRPPGVRARAHYGTVTRKGKLLQGVVTVGFRPAPNRIVYPGEMTQKATTPQERQILRELKPIIVDMLSDFQARIRLKIPTRYTYGQVRNFAAGPKVATLFSISGEDLDRHGNGFFDNEEVMLALLQMDFDSHEILQHTRYFHNNSRVPVIRHGAGFSIRPSSFHYRKFFRTKGEKQKP
jgi:hypothetical protein